MANVKLVNTEKVHELQPGKTTHLWWNNATPANAVWSVNAVPVPSGSTTAGFNQDMSVEVTRVWRKLTVTEKKPFPQSQTADVVSESEIHYEIKNIGTQKATFIVFLSIVS